MKIKGKQDALRISFLNSMQLWGDREESLRVHHYTVVDKLLKCHFITNSQLYLSYLKLKATVGWVNKFCDVYKIKFSTREKNEMPICARAHMNLRFFETKFKSQTYVPIL